MIRFSCDRCNNSKEYTELYHVGVSSQLYASEHSLGPLKHLKQLCANCLKEALNIEF